MAWIPVGAYSSGEIVLVDRQGETRRRIPLGTSEPEIVRISPDSRWLTAGAPDSEELGLRAGTGGTSREADSRPSLSEPAWGAAWSPDSRYVFFTDRCRRDPLDRQARPQQSGARRSRRPASRRPPRCVRRRRHRGLQDGDLQHAAHRAPDGIWVHWTSTPGRSGRWWRPRSRSSRGGSPRTGSGSPTPAPVDGRTHAVLRAFPRGDIEVPIATRPGVESVAWSGDSRAVFYRIGNSVFEVALDVADGIPGLRRSEPALFRPVPSQRRWTTTATTTCSSSSATKSTSVHASGWRRACSGHHW